MPGITRVQGMGQCGSDDGTCCVRLACGAAWQSHASPPPLVSCGHPTVSLGGLRSVVQCPRVQLRQQPTISDASMYNEIGKSCDPCSKAGL
jgi:hypothetical protein